MIRRWALLLVLLPVGGGPVQEAAGSPWVEDPPLAPHVVLFLADDLGWGDVGYHGSTIRTPHLDRLAREGVRLEAHYAQEMCSPSRAALFTGRYPMRYGMQTGVIRPWSGVGLDRGETLLPETLRGAGYVTHLVGKWHLGCNRPAELPTRRGFDHHYGQYTGLADYFTHEREGGLDWHRDEEPLREEGYATHLLRDEAVRVVREHDGERPLFLFVSFTAPHHPYQAPAEEIEAYAEVFAESQARTYAAMVTCLDEAMGDVLAALEERGMRDDTLVLFLSDNGAPPGGGSNTPLRGGKRDLHEGGVRVPAVVHWPGWIEGGRAVESPLHLVDWYPTLCRLAGVERPAALPAERDAPAGLPETDETHALDGLDLWDLLRTGRPLARETLLLNMTPTRGAVLRDGWKLICDFRAREEGDLQAEPLLGLELYDLASDPVEAHNLAEISPAQRDALLGALEAYRDEMSEQPEARFHSRPRGFRVPEVWGPQ